MGLYEDAAELAVFVGRKMAAVVDAAVAAGATNPVWTFELSDAKTGDRLAVDDCSVAGTTLASRMVSVVANGSEEDVRVLWDSANPGDRSAALEVLECLAEAIVDRNEDEQLT